MRTSVGVALVCIASCGPQDSPTKRAPIRASPPSIGWQAQIQAGIAEEQYRFRQVGGAWQAANRAQGLRAQLGADGVELTPRTGEGWSVRMRAHAWGRPGRTRRLEAVEPVLGSCEEAVG